MEEYYKNIAIVLKGLNINNEKDLDRIWQDLAKMFQEEGYNSKASQDLTKIAINLQKELKAGHITMPQELSYDKFVPALFALLNNNGIELSNSILQSLKKYADIHSLNGLSNELNKPVEIFNDSKPNIEPSEQKVINVEQIDNELANYRHKVVELVSYFMDNDDLVLQSSVNNLVAKTLNELSKLDSIETINSYMRTNFVKPYHDIINGFIYGYLKEYGISNEDIKKYFEVNHIEDNLNHHIRQMRLRDVYNKLESNLTVDGLKESILKIIDSLYEKKIINLSSKLLNTLLTNTLENQNSLIDLYNELKAQANNQNIERGRA